MLSYGMGVLIFCATPSDSFAISLWIYIYHVSDVQRPDFMIVESLYPVILISIAPPDWSECTPIMSGSTLLSCSLRGFVTVITALKMSSLVTSAHASLSQMSQSRFYYVPLLLKMWYTLHARVATSPFLPVDLWCKVCPVPLFL